MKIKFTLWREVQCETFTFILMVLQWKRVNSPTGITRPPNYQCLPCAFTCKSSLRCERCVQHLIPTRGPRVNSGAASGPGHTDAPGPPGQGAPVVRQVTRAAGPLPGGEGAGGFGPRNCRWGAVYCHKGEQTSFSCLVMWGQTYESLWISAVYGITVTLIHLHPATCYIFLCRAAPVLMSLLTAKYMLLEPEQTPS